MVLKEGTGWLVLGSRTGSVVIKMRGCTVSFYRGSFLYFLEFPIFGRGGEIFIQESKKRINRFYETQAAEGRSFELAWTTKDLEGESFIRQQQES